MGEMLRLDIQAAVIGQVKLGDVVLPGVMQKLHVHRAVRLDEAKVKGKSGSSKHPVGWEDAEVELSIELVTDGDKDAWAQLAILAGLFQGQDKHAKPNLYAITSTHLAAWRIRTVVFSNLTSEDDSTSDLVHVTLQFKEHRPVTLRGEGRRKKTLTIGTKAAGGAILFDEYGQGFSIPSNQVATVLDQGGPNALTMRDMPVIGGQIRQIEQSSVDKRLGKQALDLNANVDDDTP